MGCHPLAVYLALNTPTQWGHCCYRVFGVIAGESRATGNHVSLRWAAVVAALSPHARRPSRRGTFPLFVGIDS